MASLRFVHTADWHLSAGFGALPEEVASLRRKQQRECVEWLIERATIPRTRVDVLLVTGDVFDTSNPSPSDVGFLESQLRRLSEAGTQTFIIPGTGGHDAYRSGGLWDRVNLHGAHLFRSGTFEAEGIDGFEDVVVWGVACDPARPDVNLLATAAGLNTSPRSIGLYHGGLAGRYEQEGERENAFQPEDVERAPFNYLALGHYHGRVAVADLPKKKAFYPGSPAAIGFRGSELGPRYALEGELAEDGRVSISPIEVPSGFGVHRKEALHCGPLSLEEINLWLSQWADRNTYAIVSLKGVVGPEVMAEAGDLEHRHRENYGYLKVLLEFDDLSGAEENEYLRLFQQRAREEIESEADEERKALLREALRLGTEALLRGGSR